MKLLTHNILICSKKSCGINSYPLRVVATNVEKKETPLNADFLISLVNNERINWDGLVKGAADVGLLVPPTLPPTFQNDQQFLQALHDVLIDFHIVDGELVCPCCGRKYLITNGIPNMLLSEQEF
ncbi:Trm112p-like protein [Entamoeba marina]